MNTFETHESNVRSYCRAFPVVFDGAQGCYLYDEHGERYLDFFAGAGVINYGHNPPALTERLVEYIQRGGIAHGLDMSTKAKEHSLEHGLHVLAAAVREVAPTARSLRKVG